MRNLRRFLVASGALLFLWVNVGVAFAFNGPPPGSPPTGSGSIVTDASNRVGLGTAAPDQLLTVKGGMVHVANGATLTTTPGSTAGYGLFIGTDNTTGESRVQTYWNAGTTFLTFHTNSGGLASAERARIDASGLTTTGFKLTTGPVSGYVLTSDASGAGTWAASAGDITGVTAGAGLTGGGVTGAVTLDVGAGSGISVAADTVAVDATVVRTNAANTFGAFNQTFDASTLFLDATMDRIGIGTAAPDTKLEVYGSIANYNSSASTVRYYRNVAHYSNNVAGVTGTMKIAMPKSWSTSMVVARIQGYDYASNVGAWEVVVGGTNAGAWANYSAEIRGTAPFSQVRLAHDGTNNVILLGNTSTVWQYPKATVSEFIAGYSNITGWGSGWVISIITAETGIVSSVTTPIYTYTTSAGNVGVGTVAPAQKLDVSGTVQMTGFKLTTTPTNGYVLKSDAAGVGTWQPDTSGIGSLNTQTGATQTFANDTNLTISSAANVHTLGWSGTLSVARGGTGASTAAGARTNLGAAASGVNSDITSLSGLTTDLSVAQGGTGLSSPGVSGNVLTSNGVAWVSQAETGDISGVTAGTGLTDGGTTGAVTLSLAVPVAATNGGTAQTTYATGDFLYASAANTLSKLIIGSAGQVLTVSGGVPAWITPSAGTVTSVSGSGGTTGLTLSGGPITTSGTLTIGGTLAVANGGTGTSTAAAARANLGVAASGANSDITSLTGLTTDLSVAQGGTGLSSPGTSGNVLTSNGVTWVSQAPATGVGGSGTTNNIAKFTGASTVGNSQLVDNGTNVGIGVTAPNELLEVAAPTGARMILSDEAGASRRVLLFQAPTAAQDYARILGYSYGLGTGQNLVLQDSGGNVGVGTVNPAQKLDVAGTVQATGFKLTTGAVNGYVLKSDATGVGTWQAATAGTVTSVSGSGGTTGLTLTGGPITTSGTLTIGGTLAVANGGTGASTAATARTNLGAAASGANLDITSLSGLTTSLSAAQGGTGLSAPGVSGNVLTSNGIGGWISQAEVGDISGVTAGTGLTGGGTIGAVTLNLATPVTAANGGTGLTTTGAASQILGMNTTATGLEYKSLIAGSNITITPNPGSITISSAGGGEANTASNVGVGGVGVYKQKTGVNLELKNINGGSGKVSVSNDTVNNEVDVDVVESALTHDNIGGTLGVAKGGTGATTASGARGNLVAAASGANSDITSLVGLTTSLSVAQGGTGASIASSARTNLGAAASGVNSDITSLSGLTTTLLVAQGGTGTSTLLLNSVLLGNDASAVQSIAPGTSGNVLTSNGATWVSQAPQPLSGVPSSYQIVNTAGSGGIASAVCPGVKKIVGGGCEMPAGAGTDNCRLVRTFPYLGNSWYCVWYQRAGTGLCGSAGESAFAICM